MNSAVSLIGFFMAFFSFSLLGGYKAFCGLHLAKPHTFEVVVARATRGNLGANGGFVVDSFALRLLAIKANGVGIEHTHRAAFGK